MCIDYYFWRKFESWKSLFQLDKIAFPSAHHRKLKTWQIPSPARQYLYLIENEIGISEFYWKWMERHKVPQILLLRHIISKASTTINIVFIRPILIKVE